MKPIYFKEHSIVYAKNQKPYLPLPAYLHNDSYKCVSSCWGLSLTDRMRVLFTGKVWVTMPTFGNPLNPVKLAIDKPDFND